MTAAAWLGQLWFVVCAIGVVLAPIMPAYAATGAVLFGLTLLVRAKDARYPDQRWPAAARAYLTEHEWVLAYRVVGWLCTLWCASMMLDQQSRGVYLACLLVFYAFYSAAPVRTVRNDARVGSYHGLLQPLRSANRE